MTVCCVCSSIIFSFSCFFVRHWMFLFVFFFFFQAEDGIRDDLVTGVQTCALPICFDSSDSHQVLFSSKVDQVVRQMLEVP